jgi:hypothetical protein
MRSVELAVAESMVATIAVIALAFVAYLFYRQIPPRRSLLSARQEDVDAWAERVFTEQIEFTRTVLEAICDAFALERDHAWRLRPDDHLRDLYDALYPRGLGLPDDLEYESLFDALRKDFRVPKKTLLELLASEPPLADVVACCIRYRADSG